MQSAEIGQEKQMLRRRVRQMRADLDLRERRQADRDIFARLSADPRYRAARLMLCYVSTEREVETHDLIRRALLDEKSVAVPCCVADSNEMYFCRIRSLEELVPRTHGILEPDPRRCERIEAFDGALCLVPGLAFDRQGYRLGQGGGYYDRFLSGNAGLKTVGLCRDRFLFESLPHEAHDIRCGCVLTESGFVNITV